jgi:hypothetical protein
MILSWDSWGKERRVHRKKDILEFSHGIENRVLK